MLINHLCHSGTAKKLSCFGYFNTKVQEAYNIIIFWFLMKNSIQKIFGYIDVKITPLQVFLLGRKIKIFISSHLQRRPRIFKEFLLCLIESKKYYFFSILQRRPSICILRKFFAWYRIIFIFSILQKRHSIFKEFFCLVEK